MLRDTDPPPGESLAFLRLPVFSPRPKAYSLLSVGASSEAMETSAGNDACVVSNLFHGDELAAFLGEGNRESRGWCASAIPTMQVTSVERLNMVVAAWIVENVFWQLIVENVFWQLLKMSFDNWLLKMTFDNWLLKMSFDNWLLKMSFDNCWNMSCDNCWKMSFDNWLCKMSWQLIVENVFWQIDIRKYVNVMKLKIL